MDTKAKRFCNTDIDSACITPHQLADMFDSGLSPAEIDRLCFTRWRMRETVAERQSHVHGPSNIGGKTTVETPPLTRSRQI